MARSIGEAVANGLESGYRLATDYVANKDRKERQDRIDEQATAQLDRTNQRQDDSDRMAALSAQEQQLREEGQGYANSPTPPDAATQQDYAQRVQGLNQAKSAFLAKRTGVDVAAQQKLGADALAQLKAGDVANMKPGAFTRAITVSTGRSPTDYRRDGDNPAPVEQAGQDFVEGLHSDDEPRMLKGLNVMFAPELRNGVGQPSSKGGTIVAKQLIGLHPDPRSSADDPHVVPMMRVYVNGGKPFNGPLPEGAPKGTTGYYDAPLTKNRSSDPNDPVKSVGIGDAQQYIASQLKLVDMMNSPEAQQKMQEDQAGGDFNPDDYLHALTNAGVKPPPKSSIKDVVIPAGGSLLRQRVDANGNPTGEPERIEGRDRASVTRVGSAQQNIDAIDALVDDGTLTEAEGRARKRQLAETVTAPKRLSSAAGGSSGSGGNIQSTKSDSDGYVVGVFRDGTTKRLLIDGKPWKSQDLEKRVDKLAGEIGKGINGIGKSSDELRNEARKTLLGDAEAAPAAKPAAKVIKFDKSGKRVSD